MILRRALFVGLILLVSGPVFSQILDDTTRQIYGPNTSRWFTEDDLRYNRDTLYFLDSTMKDLHHFDWVQKNGNRYQDLGVIGTALKPIFFELPDQIGARSGYTAMSPYYQGANGLKFYQSLSPITDLRVIYGENNRNRVNVTFSRNVNPQWNIGGTFHSMIIDREIGRKGNNRTAVLSFNYSVFSSFHTKDRKYEAIGSFSRWLHTPSESGGIDTVLANYTQKGIGINVYLYDAYSQDLRQQYRLYHEYKFNPFLQVFHRLEKYRQNNYYYDVLTEASAKFYGSSGPNLLTDSTKDRSVISYWVNEVGLKGSIGPVVYSIGYRRRDGSAPMKYLNRPREFRENYLLGYGRYDLGQNHEASVRAEFLLGGQYKVDAHYHNRFLSVDWKRRLYQPAFLEQRYFGNHDDWSNSFANSLGDQLIVRGNIPLWIFTLKPEVQASQIDNLVYWDESQTPQQANERGQILTAGGALKVRLGNWYWESEALYSTTTGSATTSLALPELFLNSELYYQGPAFENALNLKVGISAHTWSPYLRYGYDPVVQQFHLQQTVDTPGWYPIVDAFAVLGIGPATVFLRYQHANYLLVVEDNEAPTYQATAGYNGIRARFNIGVRWYMYN